MRRTAVAGERRVEATQVEYAGRALVDEYN
jgi:hypothetical protein